MKKKLLAWMCTLGMAAGLLVGCGGGNGGNSQDGGADANAPAQEESSQGETEEAPEPSGDGDMIALITMDSIDQHWVTLNEGAQKAAGELGVTVQFMAPNTKDDAQQIECVNNAVSAGAKAIIVAANGPDAISSALQEASDAGVKIIYVASPANGPGEATFSTDNNAAGETAGKEMLKALEAAGVTAEDVLHRSLSSTEASLLLSEHSRVSAREMGLGENPQKKAQKKFLFGNYTNCL